ncbi:flavin monoamine oxidase family protein [Leeia sp.]|uniref:flavin monoamine oxidase family protein n=1 Tax=Leeia sp. TaxID=2884678 RepID=UPI0035AF0815
MSVRKISSLQIEEDLKLGQSDEFDVMVVGAGMSGLYTAWRMKKEWQRSPVLSKLVKENGTGQLRIGILEWSDRVGGRLDSRIIADMENVPAELGGMRFTDSHLIVNQLINDFGLRKDVDVFPMTDNSQFYLRGERFSEDKVAPKDPHVPGYKVPYQLPKDEQRQTPNQLFNFAIKKVCDYSNSWTDANWQWVKENFRYSDSVYRDIALYDMGFWNMLYQTLSNEGYDFVWDGGGYNSNTINWNAAEAMPYMLTDFSQPTDFKRIKTGFHQLPVAMYKELRKLNVPVYRNLRLTHFEKHGEWTEGTVAVTRDPKVKGKFKAKVLFLAMPRHSLELIDQDCSFFQDQKVQYNIQSVLKQPAYKLFLAYESRWWGKEFHAGPTITDLPLRMTYDFGSENERGGKPTDTRTLLLASYSDMQADSFWKVLERNRPYDIPPEWEQIGADGGAPAPEEMKRMAEGMLLKDLTTDGKTPTPSKLIGAYYQDWSQAPYGAGFHAWAAHYKAWEVMKEVRHPMADRHVYICGEAYSNAQGWVEGAVCTAESILEEFFQMPRLQGIPASYPLLTPKPVKPGQTETNPTYHHKANSYVF